MKELELTRTFGDEIGLRLFEVLKFFDRNSSHEQIDNILDKCNEILDGSGIEPINGEFTYVDNYYMNIIALYVNLGDTYTTTILFNTEDYIFEIISWGDFYENTDEYKQYQNHYRYDE